MLFSRVFKFVFIFTATTPVKTSPESPTTVERPRTNNAGSGQNPPTKLGAGVGGCKICNHSVFLAQRLLISGHLFHRTCFKCARCGALLSVANYYETQDGKYCCETCPDEERIIVSPSPVENGHGSLVGNRRALFETLAAADCTDDVKASKKAQRPASLKMTDSITEEKIISDDNDSGVIVSDKKESSDMKTSTSASGSRETLSDVIVDEPKEDALIVPEDQIIVLSNTELDSNNSIESVEPDGLTEIKQISSPVLLPAELKQFNGEPVEDAKTEDPITESELHDVAIKETVESPNKIQIPLSDDLKQQVLECPLSKDAEEPSAESPEDLEIKTLANKLLKMDYYESNKEVPVPSPRKKIKSPVKIDYPKSLNPFEDEDDDDDDKDKHNSTNPFGSDLEDEEELPKVPTKTNVSLNPFSSDEDENEVVSQPPLPKPRTMLSPIMKPRHQTHRKLSSVSSISSYSNSPRKKKPAPLPPKPRQSLGNIEYSNNTQVISSPNSLEDSCSGSDPSSVTSQEHYRLHKSTHGKWKRKKGPAPQCPIPQRRRIKPMPIEDIKQELLDIEIKQQELERQGVKLEKDIRLKCNEDLNNVDVEEMVLQLFELVNEKNELFRKHAELMYLRRQHNLEEEHAELEYQIRVLMTRPDHTKTDTEKAREEELIQRLVEVVEKRNEIVENLEKDRLREAEEDRSVFNQIGTFAQDETLPCNKPAADNMSVVSGKKNFSKRLLKNIKKVKSKKDKHDNSLSPSQSPSNSSSQSKGTLKKFMTLGHSSKKLLRPKST
ncbi:Hypothetical protein CINCED_3A009979 [Cinara cedri]|uniref:Zinc finger, LIM-type n=1 Tax=Cinara cedri TaxID=506608 RepID=A0A5E4MPY2_9HEMI|nr:Hypothetical protein CINCED_3A009979 [Cinara cedri]